MSRNAADGLDVANALGGNAGPLGYRLLADPERGGDAAGEAGCRPDQRHAVFGGVFHVRQPSEPRACRQV